MTVPRTSVDPESPARRLVVHVGPARSAQGGIAAVLNSYAAYEDGFARLGYRLKFVSTGGGATSGKLGKFFMGWFEFVRIVSTERVHVVHIHTSRKGSLLRKSVFACTCLFLRKPYVMHVHSGAFFEPGAALPSCLNWVARTVFMKADSVVCLSERAKSQALSSRWATPATCRLVYNGIADPLDDIAVIRASRRTDDILFLGKLVEAKGLRTLLQALSSLRDGATRFSLAVGGSGSSEQFFEWVDECGLREQVTFLGWVDGEAKHQLLVARGIFALPSRSEGFPVSIVEAMAFGMAIVSTRIPGVVDAIRDEQDGLLVSPDDVDGLRDALHRLLSDAGLCERLGVSARQRFLDSFTIEQTARALAAIYDGVGRRT